VDELGPTCRRCGENHDIVSCAHVKAVAFDEDGRIRRVEFLTPADCVVLNPLPTAPAAPALDDYPKLGSSDDQRKRTQEQTGNGPEI
jgi:hypothetical protein